MQEAVNWMMPCSLRHLFVRILIHCQPISPEQLWKNFKDGLSKDFMHLHHDLSRAQNMAYTVICEMLILEDHSI